MAVTYALSDATSIDTVEVYSDSGLSNLVETLSNITKTATGVYLSNDEFTYNSYTLGQLYYVKITWTVNSVQRSDSFPIYIIPQGQAAGSASVTDTDVRHGSHLQAPQLMLQLGRGGFRESDFENGLTATLDRFVQDLPLPEDREAEEVHLLLSSGRAGAPLALEALTGYGEVRDETEPGQAGKVQVFARAPTSGYRSSALSEPQTGLVHYFKHSRNISIHTDLHRTRPGYSIRRQTTAASATYLKRIPVDESDGTYHAAFQLADNIYEDKASPSSIESSLEDPYTVSTRRIPQGVWMFGRWVQVNGTDSHFRVLVWDGSNIVSKPKMDDAGTPTVANTGSGASVTAGTWYVRIREYDEDTGTYSGPSERTTATATASATVSAGEKIQVDVTIQNTRTTHYQVQLAMTTDTPSGYEIHYTPKDAGGTDIAGVTTGLIPKATTTVYFESDPSSGERFQYRSVRGTSLYRHANPPTGAALVSQYAGRAFYGPKDDTWLVFSEVGNPEHFYNDPTSPHEGFNTLRGEGLVDTVSAPCEALAATKSQVIYFTQTGINVFSGSFVLEINSDSTATYGGRDVQSAPVAENTVGAVAPAVCVVDQETYFFSQSGPSVFTGSRVLELDTEAIREAWRSRDPLYERRSVCAYDPDTDQVLFSFVSKDARATGVPDITLAWHRGKRQWSPPWDLDVTSWTLHKDEDDSSNAKGTRLFFGGPYGSMNEFGIGWGDGEDGSDTDADDLTSSSDTTTSVDVSGKSWTTNEWRGVGLVLTDRTTGRRYYRTIKSNDGDTLNWDGTVTDSGGGWTINIGGIRSQIHLVQFSFGKPLTIQVLKAILQDQLGVLT